MKMGVFLLSLATILVFILLTNLAIKWDTIPQFFTGISIGITLTSFIMLLVRRLFK